jgi:Aminotransferase class I and II/Glutamine amidotransferase class-I
VTPAVPRTGLRDLKPYQAPQLEMAARLNTNECPYPLPEGFRDELADAVRRLELHRYPDREAQQLHEALAKHAGHSVEGTWAANGSNEVIEQLLLAYGGPGRRVVVFRPTYVLHERLAWVTHSDLVALSLDEPWAISTRDVGRAYAAQPSVVFVCSPNNPTGNAQPVEVVEGLAGIVPGQARKLSPIVKVPHMRWNTVDWVSEHAYVRNLPSRTSFYFVHSYAADVVAGVTVVTAEHGRPFSAAIARQNVFATQFHPEKSSDAGLAIYEAFVKEAAA